MTARKPRLDVAAYRATLVERRDAYRVAAHEADLTHQHQVSAVRQAFAHGIEVAIELLDGQVSS